jgi:hypothetical protein
VRPIDDDCERLTRRSPRDRLVSSGWFNGCRQVGPLASRAYALLTERIAVARRGTLTG